MKYEIKFTSKFKKDVKIAKNRIKISKNYLK